MIFETFRMVHIQTGVAIKDASDKSVGLIIEADPDGSVPGFLVVDATVEPTTLIGHPLTFGEALAMFFRHYRPEGTPLSFDYV